MNNIEGMRIAIIGGAGFIGHHLAVWLKDKGAEVFIIDNLGVNNYCSLQNAKHENRNANLYLKIVQERFDLMEQKNIPIFVLDARDYICLTKILTTIAPDMLIHLAAVAHAGKSNKDPFSTFDHSLRTLENALDVARSPELSIKHFVYFSSSMVYGNFHSESVTEESICEPLGIYGALKFAGEKIVIAYNQVFGLPYTIVRPSALYGPRCVSRRVGQVFIEDAMAGNEICIQGDGTDRLDFTYINDLVNGVVNVIENENSRNQIFNLTYGESRSIEDMSEIVKEHFSGVKIKYLPKDKLTPNRGTLSIEKARKLIGYEPQYPLERGFVEYIKWYKAMWPSRSGAVPIGINEYRGSKAAFPLKQSETAE